MITITIQELENNIDKYTETGQKEEIEVTKNGKAIFTIVPQKIRAYNTFMSFKGRLPEDASIGEDPNERN